MTFFNVKMRFLSLYKFFLMVYLSYSKFSPDPQRLR